MSSPPLTCERARVELSARLDGEADVATLEAIEAHLAGCEECRAHEQTIASVRRSLRTQPAEPVPDLSRDILWRVRNDPARERAPTAWRSRLRVGALAAAVAALLVAGAALPFVERPANVAAASDIARRVRRAARSLSSYQAVFRVVERGWHPLVPVRHMRAAVAYVAPERFRLRVWDHADYPETGRWPRNDVLVVADEHRWAIREPWSCPTGGLPTCPVGVERRRITARQPFDGAATLPTDIIVPLETLASSEGFHVIGLEQVAGRDAYHVELPYRRAAPLVASLQAGGTWRSFRPFDRVDLWIERSTWFPLRFEVRRGSGSPLLSVRAISFSDRRPSRALFAVPAEGVAKDGGFRPSRELASRPPAYVAGLDPYRQGTTSIGQEIRAYAGGMTWLKVTYDRPRPPDLVTSAEEVHLGDAGFAYYQPAEGWAEDAAGRRRVDVYGRRRYVHLESNLSRAELLRVARSLSVRGRRMHGTIRRGGVSVRRLGPDSRQLPFVETPGYLPEGYERSSSFLTRSRGGRRTVTTYYRTPESEFDGFGIRITQGRPINMLPPSSEALHSYRVHGQPVRWSSERGEAEWREGSTYRAVAAPSFGWATVARIIRGMR